jgi:hypothetical protein
MQTGAKPLEWSRLRDRATGDVRDFLGPAPSPRSVEEVTVGWLESSLGAGGLDVTLGGFQAASLGAGLMGNTYRLKLDHKGTSTGPESVVFKCTGDSPISRQLGKKGYGIEGRPGFYGAEVRFYAQFADDLPIKVPAAYARWLSAEEDEFSLLLEDFPASRAGDEFSGCTREETIECMIGLAGLHAPLWNDAILHNEPSLKPIGKEIKPILHGNIGRAFVRLKERHLHLFSADAMKLIEVFAPHYADWVCAEGRPVALTHNDFRLDNLLFNNGHSIALDWQTFASAHPGRDTGLFLGCSVHTDTRRSVQDEALKAYHAQLLNLGVEDYSYDQCVDDFLHGTFIGLQNVVIGMNAVRSTERGSQMFMNKLGRCIATIQDHDALQRFFP